MAAEHKKWRSVEESLESTDEAQIRYQAEYVKRLNAVTDYPCVATSALLRVFRLFDDASLVLNLQ